MSSCLCKKLEGAVFPLWVEVVKDREHDSIHALDVDKADHRSGSPTHLHEAALDDSGGPQLPPQGLREAEEGQPFRQVFLPSAHHSGIALRPLPAELFEGSEPHRWPAR